MGIIFYGWRTVAIGADGIRISCPSCEQTTTADIMVYSKYFHIFWIPMFPLEKTALTICDSCGLKKYGIPLDSKSILDSKAVKSRFKHPFWTYLGITTIGLLILSGVIRLFV
jgi:hypothetical protein